MELAKPHIDLGVMTDRLAAMLSFWQKTVGLEFEAILPTGGGNHQHRHRANGSIFKLNHPRAGVPEAGPTGYRTMWLARPDQEVREEFLDPDGNRIIRVPTGEHGIEGVGLSIGVRDVARHAHFFEHVLGCEKIGDGRFRCGDSVIELEGDPHAPSDAEFHGPGIRYFTIQVFDCRREHARVLEAGGTEALAPRQLGDVAVISFVRDPDGNWIEISQRGSLTGPLD